VHFHQETSVALTDDYLAAMACLAVAFDRYQRITGVEAVLVGGAAVAIYTSGIFPSGDCDIVTGNDDALNEILLSLGFNREDRPGQLHIGFCHPGHSAFGFQQVSGALFDGHADRARLVDQVLLLTSPTTSSCPFACHEDVRPGVVPPILPGAGDHCRTGPDQAGSLAF
jgi:hypothetical protein